MHSFIHCLASGPSGAKMVVELNVYSEHFTAHQSNPIQSYLGSYSEWNAKKWSKRTPSIHSSFRMDSKVNPRPIGHTAATGIDGATEGKCGIQCKEMDRVMCCAD
eukprot:1055916_1